MQRAAAGKYKGDLPANTILTPHPGEAARLLGLTVPEVQADREGAAVSLAEKYHCVAVLKGHHTLVAAPDGTVWRNETGNAGLAKGGSGDVLSGITLAMLSQGLDTFGAACAGAYTLGASAEEAMALLKERMLMARDVTDAVEQTVNKLFE